jgi:NNP family nitrate/nitrite transporter-like MFS transporter
MMLVILTIGLGLNLRASVLIGPHLRERFGVTPGVYILLIAVPVLVTALVRVPVGVLTDRYGARVMFPAVSLVTAVSVVVLGLSESLPVAIAAGSVAGFAGAAFVVGAALISRIFPYGRRGRALGLFGLGGAVGLALSAASWGLDRDGRVAALVLAGLLAAFAAVAAIVLRDPVVPDRAGSPLRRCVEMIRTASVTSVSLLYMLALGGVASLSVFLPAYLSVAFGFDWIHTLAVTVVVIGLSSVARLGGGWWTDRRPTTRLLMICYGIAAALCLIGALAPRTPWLALPVIVGIAVCDGVASGALLALIGKAARADSAGALMGTTGAAGAFGALLPPVLFIGAYGLTGSYSVAWALLAALLLAGVLYVRARGLYIGLGLAVDFAPEPSPTTMTVAYFGEQDTQLGAAAVVTRLAELATSDELVVVYGADDRPRAGLSPQALAAGLRDRLPRHSVVAMRTAREAVALGQDALVLGEYVDAGSLAIAVAPPMGLRGVASDLSIYLQADRVVMISFTPEQGAEMHQV